MNVKVKTALIIIITLIIGILLGAMLNRALLRHKIQKTFSMHRPDKLVFFMEEMIQPRPDQRNQIRVIVEKYAGRRKEMRQQFFTEMQAERESFMKEIEPLLTLEQIERLKKGPPGLFPGRRPFPGRERPFKKPPRKWPKPEENK